MERTIKAAGPAAEPERAKSKFKKTGGGSFILAGKMIKPGQIFEAFPEDIPEAFRNLLIPISGETNWEKQKEKASNIVVEKEKVVKPVYKLAQHGKGPLWWDIVTETGKDAEGNPIYKVLNEKALKKEVAQGLLEDMQR